MIVYKYLDEKGALATIENNSVLLREPSEFNDPFDSEFYVSNEEMEKAYDLYVNFLLFKRVYQDLIVDNKKASVIGLVTKANLSLDAPIIKKTLVYKSRPYLHVGYKLGLKVLKKNDSDLRKQFKQMVKMVMQGLRRIVLVSCFGSSYDSILMWSHYADKHKGACIEFKINDKDFKPVSYCKCLPSFRLTDALEILFGHEFGGREVDTNNPDYYFLLEPILSKFNIWVYEGEIRCVYSKSNLDKKIYVVEDKDGKKTLLKMPKITKVYLGCNANDDFIRAIKDKVEDIPILKMKTIPGEYRLEVESNKQNN